MEKVSSLVPVDPHATEVVAEQVVKRVAGKERQAVGDPILLIRVVEEVGFGPPPEFADRLGSLLVGAGPDTQANSVQGVGGILLKNEGMVNAVWLTSASADFDVVREASLTNIG